MVVFGATATATSTSVASPVGAWMHGCMDAWLD